MLQCSTISGQQQSGTQCSPPSATCSAHPSCWMPPNSAPTLTAAATFSRTSQHHGCSAPVWLLSHDLLASPFKTSRALGVHVLQLTMATVTRSNPATSRGIFIRLCLLSSLTPCHAFHASKAGAIHDTTPTAAGVIGFTDQSRPLEFLKGEWVHDLTVSVK